MFLFGSFYNIGLLNGQVHLRLFRHLNYKEINIIDSFLFELLNAKLSISFEISTMLKKAENITYPSLINARPNIYIFRFFNRCVFVVLYWISKQCKHILDLSALWCSTDWLPMKIQYFILKITVRYWWILGYYFNAVPTVLWYLLLAFKDWFNECSDSVTLNNHCAFVQKVWEFIS